VSPEQVRVSWPSPDGRAELRQYSAGLGARARYLGCLILEAGSGPRLAPAVTAGRVLVAPGPAVTARRFPPMVH
jgi:hypothetical protein